MKRIIVGVVLVAALLGGSTVEAGAAKRKASVPSACLRALDEAEAVMDSAAVAFVSISDYFGTMSEASDALVENATFAGMTAYLETSIDAMGTLQVEAESSSVVIVEQRSAFDAAAAVCRAKAGR